MAKEIVDAIIDRLFYEEEGNIFAVLDGACIPDLRDVMHEHNPEHYCLYRGELEPDMAEVAPYLINLEPDSEFTDWLVEEGWGRHWGIFALSRADLRTMRQHFRKFLMVYDPDGKPMLFRYYDPRVLRLYLPTCTSEELTTIFGPVKWFLLDDDDPNAFFRFELANGVLEEEWAMIAEEDLA
jgi:Domain of unknown function (DUF4123)